MTSPRRRNRPFRARCRNCGAEWSVQARTEQGAFRVFEEFGGHTCPAPIVFVACSRHGPLWDDACSECRERQREFAEEQARRSELLGEAG